MKASQDRLLGKFLSFAGSYRAPTQCSSFAPEKTENRNTLQIIKLKENYVPKSITAAGKVPFARREDEIKKIRKF